LPDLCVGKGKTKGTNIMRTVLIASIMALSLAACGNNSNADTYSVTYVDNPQTEAQQH